MKDESENNNQKLNVDLSNDISKDLETSDKNMSVSRKERIFDWEIWNDEL